MVFASTLILLKSLKFKIYFIDCQFSRYHFRKIMLTIASQCHRPVSYDPCTTSPIRPQPSDFRLQTSTFSPHPSSLRPHPSNFRLPTSDFRPQTSDFIPQTSDLRLQTSDLRLQISSNFLQRETKILISSSQSACIDS